MKWTRMHERIVASAIAISFIALPLQGATAQDTEQRAQDRQGAERTSAEHLVSTLSEAGSFEMLLAAIEQAGLEEELSETGPYTIFAPTDAAIREAFPGDGWERVMEDDRMIAGLLRHHIVPGEYLSFDQLSRRTTLATLEGGNLRIRAEGDQVARAQFEARRGEGEQERDRDDEARRDADADTPSAVEVGNARVTRSDVRALNGVIHVIDEVLMPSGFDGERIRTPDRAEPPEDEAEQRDRATPEEQVPPEEEAPPEAEDEDQRGDRTELERRHERERAELEARQQEETLRFEAGHGQRSLAEAIRNVELFSEFSYFLDDYDELVERLEQGTYTVLAPRNEAMARVPEDRMTNMRENTEVRNEVLANHVLDGRVTVEDLRGRDSVRTLSGQTLPITTRDGEVVIGGTGRIVISDVEARNGLIHSIDAVLLPQAMTGERENGR